MLVEVAALEVDARVCVPILVDAVLEGEEYFTITLVVPSEAAGAGVSRGTPHIATIRVLDDDGEGIPHGSVPSVIMLNVFISHQASRCPCQLIRST